MKFTHKFHAKRTEKDNIKFPSKLEASYYEKLKLMQKSGEVAFFLRQVPFQLPGNIKYFVDFLIFYEDGNIEFVDVKGMETTVSTLKIKQVEELYPVEIKIVKK